MTRRMIFLFTFMALSAPLHATDRDGQDQTRHDAGTGIDPTYQALAEQTGGRVYNMNNPQDVRDFQENLINRPLREARRERWKERLNLTYLSHRLQWSETARVLVYALLKWLAYSGWCFVGLASSATTLRRLGRAAGWGAARLGLGVLIGTFLFFLFMSLHWTPPSQWPWYLVLYVAIYGPVRWLEWSIIGRAMRVPSRAWRGGGIVVSCFIDVVQILIFGSLIPIGRFFC